MLKRMIAPLLVLAPCYAAMIGQIDTFEDGTTQNWNAGGGPAGGVHPVPPANVPTGGPAGLDDNFLLITTLGGGGPGSRLVANNFVQWAGNYTAEGIAFISMDLRNFGSTDLAIRLLLENPIGGPPTDEAVTNAFLLPAGGGWLHATFDVSAAGLTALEGDVLALLSNVTFVRIFHGPIADFPPGPVVAQLGVDNIAASVPEPSGMGLVAGGLLVLLLRARSRRERRARH